MTNPIPIFCRPCIEHLQKQCLHKHTSTHGGWHFSAGEVWDDITEICDDCGAEVSYSQPWYADQQETFYPGAIS